MVGANRHWGSIRQAWRGGTCGERTTAEDYRRDSEKGNGKATTTAARFDETEPAATHSDSNSTAKSRRDAGAAKDFGAAHGGSRLLIACAAPDGLCYRERRKFRSSCFWLGLRLLNWLITRLASEPWLAWACMACSRPPFAGVERPSCKKKIRWPTPQRGAVRNSSGPAAPWETLSARPEPM